MTAFSLRFPCWLHTVNRKWITQGCVGDWLEKTWWENINKGRFYCSRNFRISALSFLNWLLKKYCQPARKLFWRHIQNSHLRTMRKFWTADSTRAPSIESHFIQIRNKILPQYCRCSVFKDFEVYPGKGPVENAWSTGVVRMSQTFGSSFVFIQNSMPAESKLWSLILHFFRKLSQRFGYCNKKSSSSRCNDLKTMLGQKSIRSVF